MEDTTEVPPDASAGDAGAELARVLEEHGRWLASEALQGSRADLSRAQLDGVDFRGANLSGAMARGASLCGACLRQAQLTHTDFTDAVLQGADLSGAHLQLTDFSGADLSGADLSGSTPEIDSGFGQIRRGPRFHDAILTGASLRDAFCARSDFSGCVLTGCDLRGADLSGANLAGVDLQDVVLAGANLSQARLTGADLTGADLTDCLLGNADLADANLSRADISGADLRGANLADARVDGIRYDRRARFRGVRAATCYGSSRFRRFAQDQDYIEEFKEAYPAAYRLWLILTDCGRSMTRVVIWSIGFTLLFALIYFALGQTAFSVSNQATMGWSLFTTLYYSVVTFTTLGFGDITPRTTLAAALVMAEVIVGYLMLGILISILATKVARRS